MREDVTDDEVILQLKDFKGFRKKAIKIAVRELHVSRGEWIVIRGENGAGKSTFLHSLMQFIKTSGQYQLAGVPIQKVRNLTDEMTFVFQNPEFQFVTNSVYEEIAYSLRLEKKKEAEIDEKVCELLDRFHLTDHRTKNPFQLSMGQKRRLSVAASIVKEQKIILLDEPTFGQDSKNTFSLLEWLETYRLQGTTIIMVAHDDWISNHFATRIWTVANGKLIKDTKNLSIPAEMIMG